MAKRMINDTELSIPCPECGHKNSKTIAWIRANDELVCAGCGKTFALGKTKVVGGLKKAQKAVEGVKASLRKIGKRS